MTFYAPQRMIAVCSIIAACGILSSCALIKQPPQQKEVLPEVSRLVPEILDVYSFDPNSFTQGLEFDKKDHTLIVGTGMQGESRLYRRTLSGTELQSVSNTPEIFGEGITQVRDIIWQLTWKNGVAFSYDANTLAPIATVPYDREGWGICAAEPGQVITSDGSAKLQVREDLNLNPIKEITVHREGQEISGLNELECLDGLIYANIFPTSEIVIINQETGEVRATIDASNIPNNAPPDINNVLNGIAAVPGESGNFLIAGKRWPDIYKVRFRPAD